MVGVIACAVWYGGLARLQFGCLEFELSVRGCGGGGGGGGCKQSYILILILTRETKKQSAHKNHNPSTDPRRDHPHRVNGKTTQGTR